METNQTPALIKVKATADVRKLSGSIINSYDKEPNRPIILRAIGAGAVNQAVKGVLTSNNFLSSKHVVAKMAPKAVTLGAEEGNTTAIELHLDFISTQNANNS